MPGTERRPQFRHAPLGSRLAVPERADDAGAERIGIINSGGARAGQDSGPLEVRFQLRPIPTRPGQRRREIFHLLLPNTPGTHLHQVVFLPGLQNLVLKLADLVVNLFNAALKREVRLPVGVFTRLLLRIQILLNQLVGDVRRKVRLLGGEINIDYQAAAVIADPDIVLDGAHCPIQDKVRRGGGWMGLRQESLTRPGDRL